MAVMLTAALWPERGFVAIWDGNVYLRCVVDAAAHGLTLDSLHCGEHQAQLYMGLLALSQLPSPGNTTLLLSANAALGAAALVAWWDVLRRLLPGEAWWAERALLVTLLAIHPVVLATLVQVNTDFGVLVFFLITLRNLVARRYEWAALSALFLCLSKETGVLVYGIMLATHLLFRLFEDRDAFGRRLARLARATMLGAAPLACYGAFLWWWAVSHHASALWNPGVHQRPLDAFRWFDFESVVLRSELALIFVLGFMWIPTGAVLATFAAGVRRTLAGLPDRPLHHVEGRLAGFLATLAALLTYALTAYRTWSNPRYFVILVPMLLLCGLLALVQLRVTPTLRRAGLVLFGVLLLSAERRAWDPVSRRLFGTFSVGPTDMYRVAGITHEFGGRGIDQLGYNLQLTGFHHAQNAVFAALRPTDSTVILFPRRVNWQVSSPLDARTFARTAALHGTVTPRYLDESELARLPEPLPRELWFLDLANDPDTLAIRSLHHQKYVEAGTDAYTARSHTIVVRHMVRR